ncbi:hypothetical protein TRFO_19570 [Tritrichomonas foetus]|uniref:Uncharacterized protein n=1 Tax=Tritrichomonas foetus TaxID=1144522 RepID=A0A1J4KMQ4_9EUKA|nr:hypothetical protein TRFO_19570 [Tritrichomonas foetus]|eukprot:OHT10982.1 hypothetical protein TRFO_19570 [Tritrichomonas foetus]
MEKEKEKDPFLIPLREALNPHPQRPVDVNKVLYNFQHNITANSFAKYSPNDMVDIFHLIWKLLLTTAGSPSSTTRLAAYRATGAFLTRITPYYPKMIHRSFSDVTLLMTIDVKSSAVIASSFAFISTYIAEPYLPKFLKSTPVFHHFASNDSAFSEHLAVIISKLGHLGSDWMKNLLQYFLERIEEKQDRYLIRAIASIIGHNPKLYIQIVLDFVKPELQKYLSLITFLISTHQEDIKSSVDLMPVAMASIDLISSCSANLADFDSALQILSIKSDSFNFEAEDAGDSKCKIKIWNDSETKEVFLDLKQVISMPSFYGLSLPLSFLQPKQDDSVLVLGAKFRTIAEIEEFDINEVFNIFEPYLSNNYDEITSAAIQGISLCINRVLAEVPLPKLTIVIRRILFTKQVSWYHSFDILRVIRNIDPRLFTEKMGENCFIELIKCLIGFCFCENDSLAKDSIAALVNLTNKFNYDIIVDAVTNRCEFFHTLHLSRSVSTLTAILLKITKKTESLDLFAEKLIEAIPMYYECINLICEVMNFFSVYKIENSKLAAMLNTAFCITFATIEIISGKTVVTQIKHENAAYFKALVENDINCRNVDIITEPSNDYKEFVYPLKCALLFIIANAGKEESTATVNLVHHIFPYECAQFYEKNWSYLSNDQRFEILSSINLFLQYVSDENVHAVWCRICIKTSTFFEDDRFKEVSQFLIKMASYYLARTVENNAEIASSYIQFLYEEDKVNSITPISEYLEKIEKSSLMKIIELYPKLSEIVPSICGNYQIPQKTVDNVETEIVQKEYQLPETIENDEIQQIVEQIARLENLKLFQKLIDIAIERNIKINFKVIELPQTLIPAAADYLANHLPDDLNLLEVLGLARTKWRPYSIAAINTSPDSLLEQLILAEKVKKKYILCLCSLIGQIKFNEHLLLKLSSNLVYNSKTVPRFRVTLKLFSTVIQNSSTISPSLLKELVNNVNKNIDKIDTDGMATALLLLAQKVSLDNDFIDFTKKVLNLCGRKTSAHGKIFQIFVGVSSNVRYVGRTFLQDLPEVAVHLLQSVLPSRFCSGARIFEQAALSVQSNLIAPFMGRGIDIIVNRYHMNSIYPAANEATYRAMMSFLIKNGIAVQHNNLFRLLPQKTALKTFAAGFNYSVAYLPTCIKIIPMNNENIKRIYTYCESLFEVHNSFNVASRCLEEWVNKNPEKVRESILLTSLMAWIKPNMEETNYKTRQQIDSWRKILGKYMKPTKVFSTLCVQLIRMVKFDQIFPTIVKIYVQNKNDQEISQLIDNLYDIPTEKCHKVALKALKKTDNYQDIIRLSLYENDCEESDKLVEQFLPLIE